jgi:hypothetical protein
LCNNNFHFIEQFYTKQTCLTFWNHLVLEEICNFSCKRQFFSCKWHMWILGPLVTLDKSQKIASHKRHHMAFNHIDSHILVTSRWDFSSIALDNHSLDVKLVKYCRNMGLPRFGATYTIAFVVICVVTYGANCSSMDNNDVAMWHFVMKRGRGGVRGRGWSLIMTIA